MHLVCKASNRDSTETVAKQQNNSSKLNGLRIPNWQKGGKLSMYKRSWGVVGLGAIRWKSGTWDHRSSSPASKPLDHAAFEVYLWNSGIIWFSFLIIKIPNFGQDFGEIIPKFGSSFNSTWGLQITVDQRTLADWNLLMSDERLNVVNVRTLFKSHISTKKKANRSLPE